MPSGYDPTGGNWFSLEPNKRGTRLRGDHAQRQHAPFQLEAWRGGHSCTRNGTSLLLFYAAVILPNQVALLNYP
jgi:hypothetical protein